MNIFDGHEDKSPEELATELGILDLSVVENAGKNIVQTLETDKWIDTFSIDILEKNMKVRIGDAIGYIKKLSKEKIEIQYTTNSVILPIKHFIKKYQVFYNPISKDKDIDSETNEGVTNISGDKYRTNDYSFVDLKRGMTLKLIDGNEIVITDIIDENAIHTTQGPGEETIMPYSAIKSIALVSIYELEATNIEKRIPLSDIQDMYKAFPQNLITDGIFVRDINRDLGNHNIAKVYKTHILRFNIKFPFCTELRDKDKFIKKTAIYKDDLALYQLGRTNIGINSQTTKEISDLKDIKKGDRVVNLRERDKDFIIWEITDIGSFNHLTEKGVQLTNGGDKIVSIDRLKENYQLIVNLEADNKENFEFMGISQEELQNNSLWEKFENIHYDKFQEGVRVRKNGESGKITKIINGIISVQYINNINGEKYVVSPATNFEVFKEDLKKGMQRTNNFKLSQLKKGMIVDSKSLNIHGFIEEINENHILINLVSSVIEIPIEDFLDGFVVDKRCL